MRQTTQSSETATHALTSAAIRMPGTHQPSDQAKARTCSQASWRSLVTTNSEAALSPLVWHKYSVIVQSYALQLLLNLQVNFLKQGHGIEMYVVVNTTSLQAVLGVLESVSIRVPVHCRTNADAFLA